MLFGGLTGVVMLAVVTTVDALLWWWAPLPLTRRLVELHGGRLELDSIPGAGTTVTLVFPASRLNPMPHLAAVG